MKLLIVESPNKVKNIRSLLPHDWLVGASVGHIRDLPKKELGVDLTQNYKPSYVIYPDKQKIVKDLQAKVKKVGKQNVYLATDPDREGEAIAYHLCCALGLSLKTTHRVTFEEITQKAITKAIENPRPLNLALVAAQESRRVIDRLVGYQLSPILWKKIAAKTPLSAGRVQSVALRMIVEREKAIKQYQPTFVYKLSANFLSPKGTTLPASYLQTLPNVDTSSVESFLKDLYNKSYVIRNIDEVDKKQAPPPPFSTSSMQQAANKRLRFSVKKTMELAQKLFEEGLITYIRTDSVNISADAQEMVETYMKQKGKESLFQRRTFKAKAGAQEAHEAIRPTAMDHNISSLPPDQVKLFQLILSRTLASQMIDKITARTQYQVGNYKKTFFLISGSVIKQKGWSAVFHEAKKKAEQEEAQISEILTIGDSLKLAQLTLFQSFKGIPKRFDEATLVKALEKKAIGRPSTYAAIISTLFRRNYVKTTDHKGSILDKKVFIFQQANLSQKKEQVAIGKDKQKMSPTEIGNTLVNFLTEHFSAIMQYEFTAHCEAQFDEIVKQKLTYTQVVDDFYTPFFEILAQKQQQLPDTQSSKKAKKIIIQLGNLSILEGPYGIYMSNGKHNVSLPSWLITDYTNWDEAKAQAVFKQQLTYKQKRKHPPK